jgi:hypothetical protein
MSATSTISLEFAGAIRRRGEQALGTSKGGSKYIRWSSSIDGAPIDSDHRDRRFWQWWKSHSGSGNKQVKTTLYISILHRRNVRKLYTARSVGDLSVYAVGKRPAVFEFDYLLCMQLLEDKDIPQTRHVHRWSSAWLRRSLSRIGLR